MEEKNIANARDRLTFEGVITDQIAFMDCQVEWSMIALSFDRVGAEGAIVGASGVHTPVQEGAEMLGKLGGSVIASMPDAGAMADTLHDVCKKIWISSLIVNLMSCIIPDSLDQRSVGIVEREPECRLQGEEGVSVLFEEFEPLQEQTRLIMLGAAAEIASVTTEILIPELPDAGVRVFGLVAN